MVRPEDQTGEDLLAPGAVAALLFVDPRTAARWAAAGRLTAVRTAGGHRRYLRSEVVALAAGETEDPTGASDGGRPGRSPAPGPRPGEASSSAARHDADTEAAAAVRVVAVATARAERTAAEIAVRARRTRLVAARSAAHVVARAAVLDAARADRGAVELARQVRRAADLAAAGVARSRPDGGSRDDARAVVVEEAVRAAEHATARETRRAALVVARGVAAAAAAVADTVADVERAMEVEVVRAAVDREALARNAAGGVALVHALRTSGWDGPAEPAGSPPG